MGPFCQSATPANRIESSKFLDLSSLPICDGLEYPLSLMGLSICQPATPATRKESSRFLNNLPICNTPLAALIPFCQSATPANRIESSKFLDLDLSSLPICDGLEYPLS